MKKLILLTSIFCSSMFMHAQITSTLDAVQDAFLYTWGGGQGANTFIKFDISSIPAGHTIDSVKLQLTVMNYFGTMDDDAKFINIHSQTWTESDSVQKIWNFVRSDTTLQLAGFIKPLQTKATSIDIKNIFKTDYNLAHTYCTILVKDIDDTTMGPGGDLLTDSNDSLRIGNHVFGFGAILYPREVADVNNRPKLIVYHSLPTIEKEVSTQINCQAYPNPFSNELNIEIAGSNEITAFEILNSNGQIIIKDSFVGKTTVQTANFVPGVYILKLQNGKTSESKKLIKK